LILTSTSTNILDYPKRGRVQGHIISTTTTTTSTTTTTISRPFVRDYPGEPVQ